MRARPDPVSAPIERASSADVVTLATDVGAVPNQVGAVLVLDGDLDVARARTAVAERAVAVPRLRQTLHPTPPGCGRPVWVADAGFRVEDHLEVVACPHPGDEAALLELAAGEVVRPLPRHRPLWRLTLVTGLSSGRTALVATFHHALADGIGGLAVLAALVDPPDPDPDPPAHTHPAPSDPGARAVAVAPPTTGALLRDAWRERLGRLRRPRRELRQLRDGLRSLRPTRRVHATRTSLNRPTGSRRTCVVARAPLAEVRAEAHANGATVNDVVLVAVAEALHATLATRGEHLTPVVVSVPVSARRSTDVRTLGNQVGVVPVAVPAVGDRRARLAQVASATRTAKEAAPTSSAAVLGSVFRLLARAGVYRWVIEHQRLVHTFVTNVRGPEETLRFCGLTVSQVVAVTGTSGNVPAAFGVLSYAGTLGVSIVVDPDAFTQVDLLGRRLQEALVAPTA